MLSKKDKNAVISLMRVPFIYTNKIYKVREYQLLAERCQQMSTIFLSLDRNKPYNIYMKRLHAII